MSSTADPDRGGPLLAAIDIGGTSIKSALLLPGQRIGYSARRPTPRGADAVLEAVFASADDLLATAVARFGGLPAALGVASLGIVEEHTGRAVYSAAVGWRDVPLAELVRERTGLPVGLGHDIRAAAHAESAAGAGKGASSCLFVAIGTGIGGAFVLDGRIVPGAHHRGAEIGHLRIRPGGRACGCGAHGCLEAHASASAITRAGTAAAGTAVTAQDVIAAAGRGEAWAVPVWTEAVDALADGLAACLCLFDPGVVVLGGGLSRAGEALLAPLRTALRPRYRLGEPPPLRVAAFADDSAVIGAGLIALELATA
ncbi:ROK family protein [Umezawaea sp. Da 62-37]|uniref:ROK family protein n=1 Tax=Umezawaea sp. Da 62-37 TaxID=3075927 RepID=UPI0028F6E8C4|nr:ROK family protein [Umezawaea sp. Da 62-37]WNV87553.1 ROK family protein [Umezawaea sp. Da 62-37]